MVTHTDIYRHNEKEREILPYLFFFLSLIIFLNDSLIHTHTSLHIATYTQVHVCAYNQNKGNVYMNLKESKKASWKGFEEGKTKIKDIKIPYMYIYANMLILIYYIIPYYSI